MTATGFDEALRPRLAALAAEMIPAGAGLPSATEAGVAGALLDEVLKVRPDVAAPLSALLVRLGDAAPSAALARVVADPADHELLALVVVGAYMLCPAVGVALRYPGQEPKPVNPFDINDVVDEGLLDAVIERGPIYRDPCG